MDQRQSEFVEHSSPGPPIILSFSALSLSSNEELAEAKKNEGNKAYQAKNYGKSLLLYTEAIKLQPNNHILYSNRSSCHLLLREPKKALEDAEKCIELNPSFAKGFYRKGTLHIPCRKSAITFSHHIPLAQALRQLSRFDEALEAIEAALKLAPNDPTLQAEQRELQTLAQPTSQVCIH